MHPVYKHTAPWLRGWFALWKSPTLTIVKLFSHGHSAALLHQPQNGSWLWPHLFLMSFLPFNTVILEERGRISLILPCIASVLREYPQSHTNKQFPRICTNCYWKWITFMKFDVRVMNCTMQLCMFPELIKHCDYLESVCHKAAGLAGGVCRRVSAHSWAMVHTGKKGCIETAADFSYF